MVQNPRQKKIISINREPGADIHMSAAVHCYTYLYFYSNVLDWVKYNTIQWHTP